jgi:hypothetical protein
LAFFSTITFSALDMEALQSPVFELQFRSNFTAAISAAAGVAQHRVRDHCRLSSHSPGLGPDPAKR